MKSEKQGIKKAIFKGQQTVLGARKTSDLIGEIIKLFIYSICFLYFSLYLASDYTLNFMKFKLSVLAILVSSTMLKAQVHLNYGVDTSSTQVKIA